MPRILCSLMLTGVAVAQSVSVDAAPPSAMAVVQRHAAHCHALHRDVAERAIGMQRAVQQFLAAPDPATLQAARAAWIDARHVYGQVEALRFHGGPIDSLEPCLNAWPIDEAYIDHVVDRPDGGIVHDRQTFRTLSEPLLLLANERGGETNVSIGWHAIEFLLWGQDLDVAGPGRRDPADFVDGKGANADRRRAYLAIVTDLLVRQLAELREAWAPGADNFRRRFEADVDGSLRRMLTGTAILTAFELCGERLAVAYETQDQEQEHSCFSDTTCNDLVANQLGILGVFRGDGDEPGDGNLLELVRGKDAAIAEHLEGSLVATLAAMRAIPAPFDQAFRGADDAPGRVAIHAAMKALEQQAEAIAIAGQLLGFELPMRPGN